jgi:hypothetical protein
MHYSSGRQPGYLARGPDSDRAIDDRQGRLNALNVPNRFPNEVPDLIGVTDVHYIHMLNWLGGKCDVNSNSTMMRG